MALAQPVERPSSQTEKTDAELKAIDENVTYWHTTCLQDWDTATHMTRKEWKTTCDRVAKDRRKFMVKSPESFTMAAKKRQR